MDTSYSAGSGYREAAERRSTSGGQATKKKRRRDDDDDDAGAHHLPPADMHFPYLPPSTATLTMTVTQRDMRSHLYIPTRGQALFAADAWNLRFKDSRGSPPVEEGGPLLAGFNAPVTILGPSSSGAGGSGRGVWRGIEFLFRQYATSRQMRLSTRWGVAAAGLGIKAGDTIALRRVWPGADAGAEWAPGEIVLRMKKLAPKAPDPQAVAPQPPPARPPPPPPPAVATPAKPPPPPHRRRRADSEIIRPAAPGRSETVALPILSTRALLLPWLTTTAMRVLFPEVAAPPVPPGVEPATQRYPVNVVTRTDRTSPKQTFAAFIYLRPPYRSKAGVDVTVHRRLGGGATGWGGAAEAMGLQIGDGVGLYRLLDRGGGGVPVLRAYRLKGAFKE